MDLGTILNMAGEVASKVKDSTSMEDEELINPQVDDDSDIIDLSEDDYTISGDVVTSLSDSNEITEEEQEAIDEAIEQNRINEETKRELISGDSFIMYDIGESSKDIISESLPEVTNNDLDKSNSEVPGLPEVYSKLPKDPTETDPYKIIDRVIYQARDLSIDEKLLAFASFQMKFDRSLIDYLNTEFDKVDKHIDESLGGISNKITKLSELQKTIALSDIEKDIAKNKATIDNKGQSPTSRALNIAKGIRNKIFGDRKRSGKSMGFMKALGIALGAGLVSWINELGNTDFGTSEAKSFSYVSSSINIRDREPTRVITNPDGSTTKEWVVLDDPSGNNGIYTSTDYGDSIVAKLQMYDAEGNVDTDRDYSVRVKDAIDKFGNTIKELQDFIDANNKGETKFSGSSKSNSTGNFVQYKWVGDQLYEITVDPNGVVVDIEEVKSFKDSKFKDKLHDFFKFSMFHDDVNPDSPLGRWLSSLLTEDFDTLKSLYETRKDFEWPKWLEEKILTGISKGAVTSTEEDLGKTFATDIASTLVNSLDTGETLDMMTETREAYDNLVQEAIESGHATFNENTKQWVVDENYIRSKHASDEFNMITMRRLADLGFGNIARDIEDLKSGILTEDEFNSIWDKYIDIADDFYNNRLASGSSFNEYTETQRALIDAQHELDELKSKKLTIFTRNRIKSLERSIENLKSDLENAAYGIIRDLMLSSKATDFNTEYGNLLNDEIFYSAFERVLSDSSGLKGFTQGGEYNYVDLYNYLNRSKDSDVTVETVPESINISESDSADVTEESRLAKTPNDLRDLAIKALPRTSYEGISDEDYETLINDTINKLRSGSLTMGDLIQMKNSNLRTSSSGQTVIPVTPTTIVNNNTSIQPSIFKADLDVAQNNSGYGI